MAADHRQQAHEEELARKFKDNVSPMKIAIVVDYVGIAQALRQDMNETI